MNRGELVDLTYNKQVEMLEENYVVSAQDAEASLEMEAKREIPFSFERVGALTLLKIQISTLLHGLDDVADFLVSKEMFLTGADNLAWDAPNTPSPGHMTLIAGNAIYIIENMNLAALSEYCQQEESFEFALVVNPPKIKGAAAMALNAFAIFLVDGTFKDEASGSMGMERSTAMSLGLTVLVATAFSLWG